MRNEKMLLAHLNIAPSRELWQGIRINALIRTITQTFLNTERAHRGLCITNVTDTVRSNPSFRPIHVTGLDSSTKGKTQIAFKGKIES